MPTMTSSPNCWSLNECFPTFPHVLSATGEEFGAVWVVGEQLGGGSVMGASGNHLVESAILKHGPELGIP